MNYGELLAYWYLRLNGFTPMVDFVLHQVGAERTSDIDLLAVRLPGVVETVGGLPGDWDNWFRDYAGVDITKTPVAVIGEVKTGQGVRARDIERSFNGGRTTCALRRLGLHGAGELIPDGAQADKYLTVQGWTVLKVAFVESQLETTACLTF